MALALDFPTSPAVGQLYTANLKTWAFDGTTWLIMPTFGVPPPLAFVSYSEGQSGGPVVTTAMNVVAGNHLFVMQAGGDASTACTDTAGNVYIGATQKVYGGATKVRWWYCLNAIGHAANVTTVTISPIQNGQNMAQALQFSGVFSAFDGEQTGQNQGDVNCGNCGGAITTTTAKPLILLGLAGGYMISQGGTFSHGTLVANAMGSKGQAAYYIPNAVSSALFTWSGMPNNAHVMSAVAFK